MPPPAIEAEGLVKRFGATTALAGASLTAAEGTVLGVLGPNGAGKTTAVRVLATLLAPDEGRARVGGFDVVTDPHRVRSLIGVTGQYAGVDEALTGRENVVLIARLLGIPRSTSKARAVELLDQFGLTDAGDRAARTYSGGMRRRLDLACSLVGRPRILFLDEPTTGLDPASRLELWGPDELKARAGAAVLQMRPSRPEQLDTVARLAGELAGTTPTVEAGTVSVAAGDESLMPAVVRRLDDVGIALSELTLRRASLDEVFLAITGRRAVDAEAEAAAETTAIEELV